VNQTQTRYLTISGFSFYDMNLNETQQVFIKKCFEYLYEADEEIVRTLLIEAYGGNIDDETLYVEFDNVDIYLKRDIDISLLNIGYTENGIGFRNGILSHMEVHYFYFLTDEDYATSDLDAGELLTKIRKQKINNI
jgi:hypothetical protein